MPNHKIKPILFILSGEESRLEQAHVISFSLGLAQRMQSPLILTVPDLRSWPESRVVRDFNQLGAETNSVLLQVMALGKASYFKSVHHLIREAKPQLIVMERGRVAHFLSTSSRQEQLSEFGEWMMHLREPLLLLNAKEGGSTFESLFVPMSGEVRSSQALEWGIAFANQMKLPLDLIHVTRTSALPVRGTFDLSLIGRTCDDFYHEYPFLVSEFLSQASPYSSLRERSVIREFIHCTGGELSQILSVGRRKKHRLAVIEWKGNLTRGHSSILRGILKQTHWSLVLIRERQSFSPDE